MPTKQPIRILHLSDFHFSEERRWDSDPALTGLGREIRQLVSDGLVPDLVAITGDVALRGQAQEYKEAGHWIDEVLLPSLPPRFPRRRLLIVPGNHDVDRNAVKTAARALQSSLLAGADEVAIASVLQDPEERAVLLRRHEAYLAFVNGYRDKTDRLDRPWWFAALTLRGHRVHVAGLCSSWLSSSDGDQGNLLIGRWQVDEVLRGAAEADLSLALVHHPWSFLIEWDATEVEAAVRRQCHLVLRGHHHLQRSQVVIDPDHACLELAAGYAHAGSDYPTAFQLVEIDPDAATVRVHYRLWYNGEWSPDWNAYQAAPEGIATFPLRRDAANRPSLKTSPISEQMFLRRLRLQDVRCIESLDLSFLQGKNEIRKWTLLLGENGSGKSTILRTIALLTAGSTALGELVGEVEDWIRIGQPRCHIEGELAGPGGTPQTVSLIFERGDNLRTWLERNNPALDLIDRILTSSPESYLTVGYGASRHLSRSAPSPTPESGSFRTPRAQAVATLFSADALLNPLQTWAVDLDYRLPGRGQEIIRGAFRGLLREMEFVDIDKRRRDLRFRTADGVVPLSQLSDGYQNIAAWCGDLLYRITPHSGEEERPLSRFGLLLIDEIDLHLHPLWQRQLRDYLDDKLPNCQIVATTHSPLTAQTCEAGELFTLRRPEPDQPPVLYPYTGEPHYLLVDQLLTSPAFGVPSPRSLEVERLRRQYRDLRDKESKTAQDRKDLARLADQLHDIPDPARASPYEQQHTEILERIHKALEEKT